MGNASKASSHDDIYQGIDFDPDALRAKYREERDKTRAP